jgi:hypothetical protein
MKSNNAAVPAIWWEAAEHGSFYSRSQNYATAAVKSLIRNIQLNITPMIALKIKILWMLFSLTTIYKYK